MAIGALDLLLPPHCPTCDQMVDRAGAFCADCFQKLDFISRPCCDRCGVPLTYAAALAAGGCCADCLVAPPVFRQARAAWRYDDASRRLVLPFKYGDRVDLAGVLAPPMARAGADLLAAADLLVPVPLHRRRLLSRRYNQAALLARELGRLARTPVRLDALRRGRPTAPLAEMGAVERVAEVSGAFEVIRTPAIDGRAVLLIDDVLTSGATANACARVLLAAGAASVDVLVAARTVHATSRP